MKTYDLTILTDRRLVDPPGAVSDPYIRNIMTEDRLVMDALRQEGLLVNRRSWDDAEFEWKDTDILLFRSTWDYFDRFGEFSPWLEKVRLTNRMVNPYPTIRWNLDKHYLQDLASEGIHIPPTLFIEKGDPRSMGDHLNGSGWQEVILKPVVSGAARHTYRFRPEESPDLEEVFMKLIREESMMLQEFQSRVPVEGEVSFMVMDGRFTHAILKKAKPGDFRVQDDFGGTVHEYLPSAAEIKFAEEVVAKCGHRPLYARVDAIWDNEDKLAVSELELIEPELWFRFAPEAAHVLAKAIKRTCF
jgi:glutathione synthase/RimK-type ligase-like ATP-grasp enzyme